MPGGPAVEHWTSTRSRIAALSRSRTPDDPDLLAARRDLRATKLEQHVAEQVAAFPPLTDEQLDRIAVLIRPTAANGGGRR